MTNKPQTCEDVLARFNELDNVAAWDVNYCCSHYGSYQTQEEAEKRKAEIEAKAIAADNWIKTAQIHPVFGWESEYGYDSEALKDTAKEILALCNHQAAVIEAMREALEGAGEELQVAAEKLGFCGYGDGKDRKAGAGEGQQFGNTISRCREALTLANAPYEVSK